METPKSSFPRSSQGLGPFFSAVQMKPTNVPHHSRDHGTKKKLSQHTSKCRCIHHWYMYCSCILYIYIYIYIFKYVCILRVYIIYVINIYTLHIHPFVILVANQTYLDGPPSRHPWTTKQKLGHSCFSQGNYSLTSCWPWCLVNGTPHQFWLVQDPSLMAMAISSCFFQRDNTFNGGISTYNWYLGPKLLLIDSASNFPSSPAP